MPEYHARNGADKPLPHNAQAEADLVASLLLDPSILGELSALIRPADFLDPFWRATYAAALELHDAGQAVDCDTLAGRLRDNGEPDAVGRLYEAVNALPHAQHWRTYAETVARKAQQRRMFLAAREAARVASDDRLAARDPEALRKKFRDALAAAEVAPQQRDGEWRLVTRCMADVERKPIRWLWPGRIPSGALTLLVGRGGEGKSFLCADLASRVSTGTPWPDGTACERGSVLLACAEDDPETVIGPRLDALRADSSRVHIVTGTELRSKKGQRAFTLADVPAVAAALDSLPDCRLIVVDPIGSFLTSGTDAHRDNEVRAVLDPLARLAAERGLAVVIVAHRRKGATDHAGDAAMGSAAFVNLARAVWHLGRDPDDKARRLFLPAKMNGAPEPMGLAFTVAGEPAAIHWDREPVEQSATDALRAEQAARRPGPEADAQRDAESFLRRALAAGPMPSKELDEWARAEGVARRTLERARKAVGVESFKGPTGWFARLPGGEPGGVGGLDPEHKELGDLGGLQKSPGNNGDFDPSETQGRQDRQVPCVLGADGPNGADSRPDLNADRVRVVL